MKTMKLMLVDEAGNAHYVATVTDTQSEKDRIDDCEPDEAAHLLRAPGDDDGEQLLDDVRAVFNQQAVAAEQLAAKVRQDMTAILAPIAPVEIGGNWNATDACPGCGCMPGDGRTEGCIDPDGCGYSIEESR